MRSLRLYHLDPIQKMAWQFFLLRCFHNASSMFPPKWIVKINKNENTGAKNFWGQLFLDHPVSQVDLEIRHFSHPWEYGINCRGISCRSTNQCPIYYAYWGKFDEVSEMK